ncbi:alsin [Plakobranchus ocellatus]|uniref:Alsin n=1 Tax=Plakobranchus ocellatus TaxID=259542 RepID=A0AAV4DKK5_9GAST|nr:alsin [Plakobranchus ocellatus]
MEIEQGNGRELGLAKVKLKDQESASGQSGETVTAVSPSAYLWKGFSDDLHTLTFDFFSQCKIISVSLGSQHSLFLTDKGLVFAQGSNGLGQLGQGSVEIKEFPEPVQVTGLRTPVTAIASGTSHNAAVTSEGQVFCWGSSMEGQCGTGCLDIVPSPSLVPVEINTGFCEHGVPNPATPVAIQSVSCGNSHTLAISWENEIWAWGAGPQLGLGDLMHAPIPRCLDSLKGKVAVAVCCGSSHSLALLLAKSKLTGTPNSSPVKTKKMVAAKATEIKEDKLYPSRCTVCNNEIYTFTENSDTCVIDALHECKPSGANSDADQTIVEDVFTSSSSQGEREDEVDSCLAKSKKMDQVGGEANNSQRFEKLQGDMIKKAMADDNESVAALSVSSSESSDNPVGETSILVVHSDDPLEAKGESISVTESDDSVSNIHNTNVGAKDCNSYEDSGGKDIKAMEKREHISMAAGQNVAAGDCQSTSSKSKDSIQEKHEPEDKQGPSKTRQRSASGTSVRSLTMLNQPVSEAMEYLQRQFEDEDLAEGQSQGSEKLHKASPSGKTGGRNLSFENVLGYPSSMVAQVKSMTSLAWTNIGTFSVFNSSGQLADSGSSNKVNVSGLSQDEQAMQSLKSSAGSSSLESAFRDSPDSGISGSDTCNSLARWSKDISAVDPDPSSLDSTGQRSLRTIQMQQRNLSSSRMSISDGQTDQRPRVVTATEVWVWGKNEHFQLGIGDQLDRASPTELKLLRG